MIKVPPSKKLRNLLKKKVVLTKYAFTNGEDAYGQKLSSISETFIIEAEIQEITAEDLSWIVPGLLDVGDAFGYFLPTYLVKGKTISIAPEDEITWGNKTWRIDKIEDYTYGKNIWYKRAYLKRKV